MAIIADFKKMKIIRILLLSISASFLVSCSQGFVNSGSDSGQSSQGEDPSGEPPTGGGPPVPPFDIFKDVAQTEGEGVDKLFSSFQELSKVRSSAGQKVDACIPELRKNESFAGAIAYFVNRQTKLSKAKLQSIANLFGLPLDEGLLIPTSLISHEMCSVTEKSLAITIGSQRVPPAKVISQINQFVGSFNKARNELLVGAEGAELKLNRLWSRFFMCLAYTESLTTADTSKSEQVYRKHSANIERKPAGVKFYEDPYQTGASVLNIGLYQFSPIRGGNIYPCLLAWNAQRPQCAFNLNAQKLYYLELLGSHLQAFNAFCGVNKVQQMFSVQINTKDQDHTHPANMHPAQVLKDAPSRCVSLHFEPGASYTHFGPLLNSTGSNLGELMSCVLEE